MHKASHKKLIVFDLDETIGHFEEFGRFIDGLAALSEGGKFKYHHKNNAFEHITQKHFNELMDLYPEFFRPHIFTVFKDLAKKKKGNKNLKVAIYTNNMGPRSWTIQIKKYIEHKIKNKLFDKIITGYRPHEKGNCRSTHSKTHKDLIKCTKLPKNTSIVFFDDQYHPKMKHDNIHYVHLVPYARSIKFLEMINRFIKANKTGKFGKAFIFKPNLTEEKFISIMYQILQKLGRNQITYVVKHTKLTKEDLYETKRIKQAIKKFIGKQSRKHKKKTSKRKTKRRSS
jgi:hypothetical protein